MVFAPMMVIVCFDEWMILVILTATSIFDSVQIKLKCIPGLEFYFC